MDIETKKEKLLKNEIFIFELNSKEVELIKNDVKKDLDMKKKELNDLNRKIKEIKNKIDNLNI